MIRLAEGWERTRAAAPPKEGLSTPAFALLVGGMALVVTAGLALYFPL